MIIEIDLSFKKDLLKLKNQQLNKRIINKLESIEKVESLNNIPNIKVMKWFPNFYRIRIWDYRIGVKLENNIIIFLRIRSRKDIYNIFP